MAAERYAKFSIGVMRTRSAPWRTPSASLDRTRDDAPVRVASALETASAPGSRLSRLNGWPTPSPCRRFVAVLTDANTRLGASVDRYSSSRGICTTYSLPVSRRTSRPIFCGRAVVADAIFEAVLIRMTRLPSCPPFPTERDLNAERAQGCLSAPQAAGERLRMVGQPGRLP